MHESVDVHNPTVYTRSWFCWADSLNAELVAGLTDRCPPRESHARNWVMSWRDTARPTGGGFAAPREKDVSISAMARNAVAGTVVSDRHHQQAAAAASPLPLPNFCTLMTQEDSLVKAAHAAKRNKMESLVLDDHQHVAKSTRRDRKDADGGLLTTKNCTRLMQINTLPLFARLMPLCRSDSVLWDEKRRRNSIRR